MTAEEIALVQSSWRQIAPIADTAATLFYARLFELDASLRPLFPDNLEPQGRKLMGMLGTVIGQLGQIGTLVEAVQDLGRRHVGYGVQPSHYETVGEALLWTVGAGLGEEATPEVLAAWRTAYALLSSVMQDAARVAH